MAKNKMNKKGNIRGHKQVGRKDRRPKPQAEEYDLNATTVPNRNALRIIRQGR
jgi:hypothetical protein